MNERLKNIGHIDQAHDEKIKGFKLSEGLTTYQIDQLIDYSNSGDEAVMKNTSDPKRFANREAVESWLQKGRFVYTITNEKEDLLGIVWLGTEAMPQREFVDNFDSSEYGVTFAIRLYGEARGKRLSGKLTEHAITQYKQTEEYKRLEKKGIWLEVSDDNTPAKKSYQKSGYNQVTQPDKHGKILMALPKKE